MRVYSYVYEDELGWLHHLTSFEELTIEDILRRVEPEEYADSPDYEIPDYPLNITYIELPDSVTEEQIIVYGKYI